MVFCLIVAAVLFTATSMGAPPPASVKIFYVSPAGNDSWSGILASPKDDRTDGPFRTVQRARDQIRSERGLRLNHSYTVLLRGGIHELDSTLVFGPEDSGTQDLPVTYSAYRGEAPVISGGKRVSGNWKRSSENPNIWQLYLPEVKQGSWYFRSLFVNGKRRNRARWPKQGYSRIESLLPGAIPKSRLDPVSKRGYVYGKGDVESNWKNMTDIEVVTLSMWTAPRRRIKTISSDSRQIIFANDVDWPFGYWGLNWFYVENVYEKLGPGEWYLDRNSGKLSYWPLVGEDIDSLEFIAPKSSMDLVQCKAGSKYLRFENMSFAYSDSLLNDTSDIYYLRGGNAIVLNGENITIENCHIIHIGGDGVVLYPESTRNSIRSCVVDDLGGGGIKILGSYSKAFSNLIKNGGIVDHAARGIVLVANNESINNEVCHLPYIGIISEGENANVSHNHVHDVMEILSDGAGIYRCPDPGSASIDNNLVHDIGHTSVGKIGAYGIYLDDGAHDVFVENNIVYNTVSACLHLNHGHGNAIRNNIFAFSEMEGLLKRSTWLAGEGVGWIVERNIFMNDGTTSAKRDMIVNTSADRRYRFDNNLYFVGSNKPLYYNMDFTKWQKTKSLELVEAKWNPGGQIRPDRAVSGKWEGGKWVDGPFQDAHSIVTDPLFTNPKARDFKLRPGSPAFKIGFHPIDISRIGIQRINQIYSDTYSFPGSEPAQ